MKGGESKGGKSSSPSFPCKRQESVSFVFQIYMRCFPCFLVRETKMAFSVSIDLGFPPPPPPKENNRGMKGIVALRPWAITSIPTELCLYKCICVDLLLPNCLCFKCYFRVPPVCKQSLCTNSHESKYWQRTNWYSVCWNTSMITWKKISETVCKLIPCLLQVQKALLTTSVVFWFSKMNSFVL